MAFTQTTVLVEIQPDSSKFEAQLKRQLETALRSLEASASSSLKINLQVDSSLATTNKQIQQVSVSSHSATLALQSAARSLEEVSAALRRTTPELNLFGKAVNLVAAGARAIELVTKTAANIATVVGFATAIKGLGAAFAEQAKDVDGFIPNLKAFVRALASTLLPADQAKRTNELLGTTFEKTGKAVGGVADTLEKLAPVTSRASDATKSFLDRVLGHKRTTEEANKVVLGQAQAVQEVVTQVSKVNPIIAKLKDETGSLRLGFLAGRKANKELNAELINTSAAATQAARSGLSLGGIFNTLVARVRDLGARVLQTGVDIGTTFTRFLGLNLAKGAFSGITKAAKELGSTILDLTKRALGLGDATLKLGPLGSAGVAIAGLGLIAAAAVASGKAIISAAQAASRLQESNNAVKVTLGDAAAKFRELIGNSSDLGLSQSRLNEAITPIIPLLKNAGLRGDELAGSLNQLVRRAVDLASIFNIEVDRALGAFAAGLRGETEPLERLGVSFNALSVDQKAAELGFKKLGGQFSESAKQVARYQLILEKSIFAQGDFERTSTSLANAQRVLGARIEGVRTGISEAFLPAAEALVNAFSALVKQSGPDIINFFRSITPIITEVSKLFTNLLPVINTFSITLRSVFLPILTRIAQLLNALSPIIQVFLTRFFLIRGITALVGGLNVALLLLGRHITALAGVSAFARAGLSLLGSAITGALAGPIGLAVGAFLVLQGVTRDTTKDFEALAIAAKKSGESLTDEFFEQIISNGPGFKGFLLDVKDTFSELFTGIKSNAEEAVEKFRPLFAQSAELAKKLVEEAEAGGLSKEVAKALRVEFDKLTIAQEARNGALAESIPLLDAAADAEKEFAETLSAVASKVSGLIGAASALKSANKAITDSQKAGSDATVRLNELQVERARILRETITPLQETIAAERDLLRTRAQLRDLDQEQLAAEQELAALRDPGNLAEQLSALDRDAERAKIALNRAIRTETEANAELTQTQKDQKAAQESLIDTEKVSINLAGLSLDQIRTRLANIRETLKLQRAAKKESTTAEDTGEVKSQAELDEEAALRRLDVLDAEQALKDLQASRQKVEADHAIQIRELEEKIQGIELTRLDTIDQQNAGQDKINALRRGETTIAAELKVIDDQITTARQAQRTAQEAITQAVEAQKIAQLELTVEQDKALGKSLSLIENQKILNELKGKQADADALTLQLLQGQNNALDAQIPKLTEAERIANSGSPAESGFRFPGPNERAIIPLSGPINDFGNITSGISNPIGGLAKAGTALSDSAKLLNDVIKSIIRQTGISIPGFAQGGVVEAETLARVGEGGRREVVLPLTRPARLADLLSHSKVLPPVLDALARVILPRTPASASPLSLPDFSSSSTPLQMQIGSGRTGSKFANEQEKRKSDRQLARMIAEELIAAGVSQGGNTEVGGIHVSVQNPNPEKAAWLAAKSIQRALSRLA